MSGKFCQQVFQVFVDAQVVCFCSLYQTVKNCACLGSANRGHVDPVLPSQSEWTDGLLCEIIIHWDSTIGEEDAEELFLMNAILKILIGVA